MLKVSGVTGAVESLKHVLSGEPAPRTLDIPSFLDQRDKMRAGGRSRTFESKLLAVGDVYVKEAFDELSRKLHGCARIEVFCDPTPHEQMLLVQWLAWLTTQDGLIEKTVLHHCIVLLGGQLSKYWTPHQLYTSTSPVTKEVVSTALNAWNAYTHSTPEQWVGLLSEDLSALPYLRYAVFRALQELPSVDRGLSRTAWSVLDFLSSRAEPTFGQVLQAVGDSDTSHFMGDLETRIWLREFLRLGLCRVVNKQQGQELPRIGAFDANLSELLDCRFTLSVAGLALVSGKRDLLDLAIVDYWWGGTRLNNHTYWRWDSRKAQLIAPAQGKFPDRHLAPGRVLSFSNTEKK
ncbi:hypothetical protein A7D25_12840 [Pseudomonas sp. 21C1]|nr:hypothetical protein A7D25_12840 [Pseudomonas sp. 21C1]